MSETRHSYKSLVRMAHSSDPRKARRAQKALDRRFADWSLEQLLESGFERLAAAEAARRASK